MTPEEQWIKPFETPAPRTSEMDRDLDELRIAFNHLSGRLLALLPACHLKTQAQMALQQSWAWTAQAMDVYAERASGESTRRRRDV